MAVADTNVLIEASTTEKQYSQLPKFPAITRDLAIVVKDELYVAQIIEVIKQKGGNTWKRSVSSMSTKEPKFPKE